MCIPPSPDACIEDTCQSTHQRVGWLSYRIVIGKEPRQTLSIGWLLEARKLFVDRKINDTADLIVKPRLEHAVMFELRGLTKHRIKHAVLARKPCLRRCQHNKMVSIRMKFCGFVLDAPLHVGRFHSFFFSIGAVSLRLPFLRGHIVRVTPTRSSLDLPDRSCTWSVRQRRDLPLRPRTELLPYSGGVFMKRIVFVCVENSNRSQMAEAFARIHGYGKVEAFSAGSRPSGKINPKAVEAMREIGYDLTTHSSKGLDAFNGQNVDVAVTMGCGDECPLVRASRREEWNIPDPRDMTPEQFREVRDLIERKVKELLAVL